MEWSVRLQRRTGKTDKPQTEAYLTLSKAPDDGYKVVTIYGPKETRRMRKASEPFETIPTPQGVDLIAALFLSPDCFNGPKVHDGEDDYEIKLLKRRTKTVNATRRYYSGPGIQCDYQVRDNKGRKRRIQIVLAEINGNTVAVAASIKIPLLPDPAFRLLMADAMPSESAEKSTATAAAVLCLGILRGAVWDVAHVAVWAYFAKRSERTVDW